ncbi:MAG: phosphoribosylanthranilate isomerase [Candidatus Omnitrophota bacterium]
MVKVKICGITNHKDARDAIACGCGALGFVFYKKSSRYISPHKARGIIKRLPVEIIKVGVFVDSGREEIKDIAKICDLDMLQLHGSQGPDFCRGLGDYKVIKAFRIKERPRIKDIKKYNAFAYLFDTYSGSKYGGTGRAFDWKLLEGLRKIKKPIFLAGGLSEKNVREAVKIVRPEWVDLSSSVEVKPGKKDYKKMKSFIKELRKDKKD